MNQYQKIKEIRAENTAIITKPKEDWLLRISGWPVDILDLGKITPKILSWPVYLPWEEEEIIPLVLPERLTDPRYGSAELEQNLKEMAKKLPESIKCGR